MDSDRIRQLGNEALGTLQRRAEAGDVPAAKALADYARDLDRTKLSTPVPLPEHGLKTTDDVMEVAESIAVMTSKGELTFAEASCTMAMLQQFSAFLTTTRLDEIDNAIKALERQKKDQTGFPDEMLPSWMKQN
ncbi:MAG: hypothetical protein ABJX32_18055 [Tateyamaria sp.]|uniref:hypothetical protein n=1 Tax=Tateyamaria sp. TaxID=1929288 RepID=UPI00329F6BA7